MKIALAGNPNCGKTTLFNLITGQNMKVGNWGGVTVDVKVGKCKWDNDIEVVDLPGVYSLNPISSDEIATVEYLKNNCIDCVLNCMGCTTLKRSLALTIALIELDLPMVLTLNMQDKLARLGFDINHSKLSDVFGLPVHSMSASNGDIDNAKALIELAKKQIGKKPKKLNIIYKNNDNNYDINGDDIDIVTQIIARHKYIDSIWDSVCKTTTIKLKNKTRILDKILLSWWGLPIFAVVLFVMYFLAIQVVGKYSGLLIDDGFSKLAASADSFLSEKGVHATIIALLVNGLFVGLSTVLAFLPQIAILFLFIVFFESSGYMARVAVVFDRLFTYFGLSGKSVVSLVMGSGCSVPAIMSTRTIDNNEQRERTITVIPFVPCSAKLPVFALIAGSVFSSSPFVAPSLYFVGIFSALIGAKILNIFKSKSLKNLPQQNFILELPDYSLPKFSFVLKEIADSVWHFLKRIVVLVLPAAIIIWALGYFNFTFKPVDIQSSMLASFGKVIAPLFAPLGFGNWQSSVALLSGTFAKETIVATFGVIFGQRVDVGLLNLMHPWSAYAFCIFILLSVPCVAAVQAMHKELGFKKTVKAALFQTAFAYVLALIINQIGNIYHNHSGVFLSIIIILLVVALLIFSTIILFKNKNKGCNGCTKCKNSNDCKKCDMSEKFHHSTKSDNNSTKCDNNENNKTN